MVKLDKRYMLNLMNGVRGVLFLMDDSPEKNRMLEETKKFISFLKGQVSDDIPEKELSDFRKKMDELSVSNPKKIENLFKDYDYEKNDQELLAVGRYVGIQLKKTLPTINIPDSPAFGCVDIHLLGYRSEYYHVTEKRAKQISDSLSAKIHDLIEVPEGYDVEVSNLDVFGCPESEVHIYVSRSSNE